MSYDLVFWKQRPECAAKSLDVYLDLMDDKSVEGLETIPTNDLLARVHAEFPGIQELGALVFWEGNELGFFEIHRSKQHVHICCRQLSASEMNKLIDIAAEFQCPLYDPQVDKRYV